MKTNYNKFESIDRLAHHALNDYEVPFESADWAKMVQKLDKKEAKPASAVWFVKGVEVVLTTATLVAMLYFAQNTNSPLAQTQAISSENELVERSKSISVKPITNPNTSFAAHNLEAESSSRKSVKAASILVEKAKNDQKSEKTEKIVENAPYFKENTVENKEKNAQQVQKQGFDTQVVGNRRLESQNEPNLPQGEVLNAQNLSPFGQNIHVEAAPAIIRDAEGRIISTQIQPEAPINRVEENLILPSLPSISPSLLENELKIPTRFTPRYIAFQGDEPTDTRKQLRSQFSIGLAASADYNSVLQNSYDGIKLTNGVGQTFGAKLLCRLAKRFSLETGVFSAFKTYKAAKDYAVSLPASQVVQETSLNILQIPLNMVVDAYENEDWRVYAKAGVSYSIVTNGSYTWRDGSVTSFDRAANTAATTQTLLPTTELSTVTAYEKNNAVSLNMGMGVARRINRRLFMTAEPTYQHAVKGIGTTGDLINSASLLVSLNYTL